jgi:hypothetical protein
MMAVVQHRAKLKRYLGEMRKIGLLAESCARQLTGWARAVDSCGFEGRRHLPEKERSSRDAAKKAQDFRLNFLRNLKPDHQLYNSSEARAARGESVV